MPTPKWSPEYIAAVYLSAPTLQEAANRLGRSVRWLSTRIRDPAVRAAIAELKSEMRSRLIDTWQQVALLSLNKLAEILQSPTSTDSAKIDAARVVLQTLVRMPSGTTEDVEIV
jgi:endonuclease III